MATKMLSGITLALLLYPCMLWAEPDPKSDPQPGHVLVFDLRTEDPTKTTTVANKVFAFPADTLIGSEGIVKVMDDLKANCDKGDPCQAETVLAAVAQKASASSDRWISTKGDLLAGYVVQDPGAKAFNLKIDEKRRSSQITADLGTLFKVIKAIAIVAESTNPKITRFDYTLTKTRANLTVEVTPPENGKRSASSPPSQLGKAAPKKKEGTEAPEGPTPEHNPLADSPPLDAKKPAEESSESKSGEGRADTADSSSSEPLTAELVTGPKEHWFLSADLPINKVSEVKLNEETGKLEPKEKPSKFLIGIDYMLGDLFQDSNAPLWGGVTLKLLAEASSKPRQSLGYGIGYRLRSIKFLGNLELDTFSIFVGRIRVQEDKKAAGDSVSREVNSFKNVIGLSFNLDKALEFLKKEK